MGNRSSYFVAVAMSCIMAAIVPSCVSVNSSANSWHYNDWHYRIPVSVDAGMYERNNCIAAAQIDFKRMLEKLRPASALDINSIRVTELTDDGNEMKTMSNYSPPDCMVSWEIKGVMASMTSRNFYIYFDQDDDGKKAAHDAVLPARSTGKNLLVNSSFEEITNGKTPPWQVIAAEKPGEINVADKEAHSGEHSICIVKTENETSKIYGYNGWIADIPVKPKTKYLISGWIKAEGKGRQVIQLFTLDEKKKSSVYVMACGVDSHDWQLIDKILVTKEESRFAGLKFFIAQNASCTAYFDDIELKELPEYPEPEVTINEIEQNTN